MPSCVNNEASRVSARIVLVGGGVRCGKSAFALARARALGATRLFIATAEARDAEMRERIADHRRERGTEFETLEVPLALADTLAAESGRADVIVIDCLSLWLSNLLLRGDTTAGIAREIEGLCAELQRRHCHVVMVTNEVGMGIVPDNALARRFRDAAGRLHQRVAAISDELYVGVLGTLLRLKPEPVSVMPRGES
jgi:adenosylcobinamide kinase/adenosylcobinamide-phosphate guanylyltransferase